MFHYDPDKVPEPMTIPPLTPRLLLLPRRLTTSDPRRQVVYCFRGPVLCSKQALHLSKLLWVDIMRTKRKKYGKVGSKDHLQRVP